MNEQLDQDVQEKEKTIEQIAAQAYDNAESEASNSIEDGPEPSGDQVQEKPQELPEQVKYLKPEIREKWNDLPPEVQTAILQREEESHKQLTAHDQERNFGRTIREIVNPYLPIITAEGGKPEDAIKSLLNTAYVLRQGNPQQKQELFLELARQYNIQIPSFEQEYVDPEIMAMREKIAMLEQYANPDVVKNQLQEQLEAARIEQEIKAFAADPKNDLFATVRPIMASLLQSGHYNTLQEAYDAAIHAHPDARRLIEQRNQAEQEKKRRESYEAKKAASSSVSGSPASIESNSLPQNMSIEDTVRRAYEQVYSNSQV